MEDTFVFVLGDVILLLTKIFLVEVFKEAVTKCLCACAVFFLPALWQITPECTCEAI